MILLYGAGGEPGRGEIPVDLIRYRASDDFLFPDVILLEFVLPLVVKGQRIDEAERGRGIEAVNDLLQAILRMLSDPVIDRFDGRAVKGRPIDLRAVEALVGFQKFGKHVDIVADPEGIGGEQLLTGQRAAILQRAVQPVNGQAEHSLHFTQRLAVCTAAAMASAVSKL